MSRIEYLNSRAAREMELKEFFGDDVPVIHADDYPATWNDIRFYTNGKGFKWIQTYKGCIDLQPMWERRILPHILSDPSLSKEAKEKAIRYIRQHDRLHVMQMAENEGFSEYVDELLDRYGFVPFSKEDEHEKFWASVWGFYYQKAFRPYLLKGGYEAPEVFIRSWMEETQEDEDRYTRSRDDYGYNCNLQLSTLRWV